jgi:archaellum component FlaG (FlaF/FlaG flagellin family)
MMRYAFLLLMPAFACAAPAVKIPVKPDVELKLVSETADTLSIEIQNRSRGDIDFTMDSLVVEIEGENGKRHRVDTKDEKQETHRIPAGESKSIVVHTCHSLPLLEGDTSKVTFRVQLNTGSKSYRAKPLKVDRS